MNLEPWNFEQLVESPKHQHGARLHRNLYRFRISRLRKTAVTWILARVFEYLLSFLSQILDIIYWTGLIFILIWRDTEHQKFKCTVNVWFWPNGWNIRLMKGLFPKRLELTKLSTFLWTFFTRNLRPDCETIFRVRLHGLTEKGPFLAWAIFENKLNSFRKIIPLKILSSKN